MFGGGAAFESWGREKRDYKRSLKSPPQHQQPKLSSFSASAEDRLIKIINSISKSTSRYRSYMYITGY